MKDARRSETRLFRFTAVCLGLTLLSMRGICSTYASFTTEAASGDVARAAAFVFDVNEKENSKYIDLTGITKPGDSQEFKFTVTNKSGSAVSEVSENYTIKIQIDGSMPIECTVQKADAGNGAGTGTGSETGTGAGSDSALLTVNNYENENTDTSAAVAGEFQSQRFDAGTEQSADYTLTAKWPAEENDEKYASASGQGVIRLTITGLQED